VIVAHFSREPVGGMARTERPFELVGEVLSIPLSTLDRVDDELKALDGVWRG
jgi:hypothetical protein